MEHRCTLHPSAILTSFCDTCKDVVCSSCIQFGPHADIRHQIFTINEAVQIKKSFFNAFIDAQVNPLREKTSLRILTLEKEQQRYINDKKVIQKDIKLEFQGINNRISFKVNQEIIRRQSQIKANQQIINKIQDLTYSFEALIQFPQRFLMSYKQFDSELKYLQSLNLIGIEQTDKIKQQFYQTTFSKNVSAALCKPTKLQITITRQFAFTLSKASQLPDYSNKNQLMNGLIVRTINHYKQQLKKAKKDVIQNQKRILSLYNHQNQQLLASQAAYVCAYCLTSFSYEEVNEPCSHNKSFKSEPSYKDTVIPAQVKGIKIHYWTNAKKSQRPVPDLKTHTILRNLHKKQFLNSLKDIRQVKYKLRQFDIKKEKENSYLQVFNKDDPEQTGKVTPLAFLYILTNKFQINQTQVLVLSELCHVKDENMINYRKMEEILQKPETLYNKFLLEEEQMEKAKPVAPPSFKYRY